MAVKSGAGKDSGTDVAPSFADRVTQIKQFLLEVKQEFGKIVWPGKKQAIMSTTVVVILVILVAIYLGTIDLILGKLVGTILR